MRMLVLKETGRTAKFILSILVDPIERLIGAFAKLRKGTIRFVTSVCLSVRSHGKTLHPIDGFSRNLVAQWSILRKSVEKIQVS